MPTYQQAPLRPEATPRRVCPEELLEKELDESALVAGHLGSILHHLDQAQPEECLEVLEAHLHRIELQARRHDEIRISPQEWTQELALADHLMLTGYQLWQEGLEALLSYHGDHDLEDEALNLLLQGNRNFILVERLARMMKGEPCPV